MTDNPKSSNGRTPILLVILLLLALWPSFSLLLRATDMPLLGHFGDDTIYFECARSLATGAGYRIPSLPGQPFQTKYPPLWPLALSAVWSINPTFPANLALATVLGWAAVPVYLVLAWFSFVQWGFGRRAATVLACVLACNGMVLLLSTMVMTELWFSAALLACLLCAERSKAPLAGALAAVAYLVKSSALPLLASLPFCFALRRQYRRAALAMAPLLIAVAGWNVWARLHASHSTDLVSLYNTSYFGFYLYGLTGPDFLRILTVNLRQLPSGLSTLLLLDTGISLFEDVLCVFVLLAAVSGVVRLFARGTCRHYAVFALGYIAQLVSWNFVPTTRLLFPLLPLLLAGLAAEILHAVRVFGARQPGFRFSSALALATIVLSGPLLLFEAVVTYGAVVHTLPNSLAEARRTTADKSAAYRWIAANTPATAQFLADDDELLYLHTGRIAASQIIPAVLFYRADEAALQSQLRSLPDYARSYHLDYVLVTATDLERQNLERYRPLLNQTMSAAPGFVRVYHSDRADIYKDER